MTKAIAAFERTADFAPFDSKYDRSLRGEATLSVEEAAGRDSVLLAGEDELRRMSPVEAGRAFGEGGVHGVWVLQSWRSGEP